MCLWWCAAESWLCGFCMLKLLWPSLSLSHLPSLVAFFFFFMSPALKCFISSHRLAFSPQQSLPPLQASHVKHISKHKAWLPTLCVLLLWPPHYFPSVAFFILPSLNKRGKTAGGEAHSSSSIFSQPLLLCFSPEQSQLVKLTSSLGLAHLTRPVISQHHDWNT